MHNPQQQYYVNSKRQIPNQQDDIEIYDVSYGKQLQRIRKIQPNIQIQHERMKFIRETDSVSQTFQTEYDKQRSRSYLLENKSDIQQQYIQQNIMANKSITASYKPRLKALFSQMKVAQIEVLQEQNTTISPTRQKDNRQTTQSLYQKKTNSKNHSQNQNRKQQQFINHYLPLVIEKYHQKQIIKPLRNEKAQLFYQIGQGNNCEIVKKVLQTRPQWSEAISPLQMINLRWFQWNSGYDYNRLEGQQHPTEIYNHFEFHKELTTKTGLLKNLQKYSILRIFNPFTFIPISFQLNLQSSKWDDELNEFLQFYHQNIPSQMDNNSVKRTLKLRIKKDSLETFRGSANFKQPQNSRTTRLTINPEPQPYRDQRSPSEYRDLKLAHSKIPQVFLSNKTYLWLLKPADMNRGNGVHVFQTLQELEDYINSYYVGRSQDTNDQNRSYRTVVLRCRKFILQKYLEQPLLIHGRKFDIRVWVLVTHKMQWYVFPEGYIRTSSQKFTLESQNEFIHLTNNAIQKNSAQYNQFEEGNQMSYQMFQEYLRDYHPESTFQKILSQMRYIISITRDATNFKINKKKHQSVFEVFGFDFMIDRTFKVWLIEVNTNPCLEESSRILKILIPRMLDDAFKLTIDEMFETPKTSTTFHVPNYPSDKNMWQLIV